MFVFCYLYFEEMLANSKDLPKSKLPRSLLSTSFGVKVEVLLYYLQPIKASTPLLVTVLPNGSGGEVLVVK